MSPPARKPEDPLKLPPCAVCGQPIARGMGWMRNASRQVIHITCPRPPRRPDRPGRRPPS